MAAEKFLIFITCECKIELGKFRPFRTRGTLPYIFEISLEFKSLLKKIENQDFKNHITKTTVKYHSKLHRYLKGHVTSCDILLKKNI